MRYGQFFKHMRQPCSQCINVFNWQVFVSRCIEEKVQIRFQAVFGIIVADKYRQKRQWLDDQGNIRIMKKPPITLYKVSSRQLYSEATLIKLSVLLFLIKLQGNPMI